jgi:hypothetical protein
MSARPKARVARIVLVVLVAAAVGVALLVLAFGCERRPSAEQIQAWNRDLTRLQTEQDSLRAIAAELVSEDPRILGLPPGDVVIAVPTEFIRTVLDRLFRDVVDHVTLSLSGVKAHASKKVKKVVTIGQFTVDVDIRSVLGRLGPGLPEVAFGGDSVSLSLPVSVSSGHGEAMVHFVWDGKNVADLACGDLDITQRVTGTVIPAQYTITGAFVLSKRDRHVVGTPRFPETRIRLRLKPSRESWAVIDSILAEKHGVCGWVLDKVDVRSILKNLAEEKGFNVKLPLAKLKPVTLPLGIQDSVSVGDNVLAIDARTNTVRIDPDAIWYSADVQLEAAGLRQEATP